MASIPPILDVRDDLYRALEATDEDEALAAELDEVIDRLDAFAERDRADQEGVVDDIDNQLLRIEQLLEERGDDAAARDVGAARNRIHIYRESIQHSADDLAVVDSGVRHRNDPDADGLLPVDEATDTTITVTVANSGDDVEIVPVVSLYTDDGDEVESVRGPTFDLGAGEQGQIELDVDVPRDASLYAVSVTEAGPGA